MLTLFIIPSHAANADVKKTVECLSGIDLEIKIAFAESPCDINGYEAKDKWFGIFWDNEYIDEALKEAIPIFFAHHHLEAMVLYKKNQIVQKIYIFGA